MSVTKGKVIILGAGIGGICAALAFAKAGINYELYEQAPEFTDAGAGIQVWVKGMRALEQLGLAGEVRGSGSDVRLHQFLNANGRPLYDVPLAEFAARYSSPLPVMITRHHLIAALSGAVESSTVSFGKKAVDVQENQDGVIVRFDDGTETHGDLLIAADGINSKVRQKILPTIKIRTAGYRYARSLVRHEHPFGNNSFTMVIGRGNRFAVGDCGNGVLYWLVGLKKPTLGLDAPKDLLKKDLLSRFRSFPEGVASIIEHTEADELIHHTVRDVEPIERWGSGRIILLGDAAHATTPNLGRGSGEAMVDALVLSELLAGADLRDRARIEDITARYSSRRKPEAESLQKTSWTIGNITSWDSPLMAFTRDIIMRTVAGRKQNQNIEEQFAASKA